MVVSAHPLATEAGHAVLQKGGNAFDAATAMAFMLAVAEPSMSGIGGRLQAMWHKPGKGTSGLDATTQAPAGYVRKPNESEDGYGTVGVPGMVKGIVAMHAAHGRLPLKDVMQPSIDAASKGFAFLPDELRRQSQVLKDTRVFEGTARHFIRNDTTPGPTEALRQPALAATLKTISKDGGKSFYNGGMAYDLAKEVEEGGGSLKLSDMEAYRATESKMLRGSYRGYEVVGMGLPCYGAIVIEMLHMLALTDLSRLDERDFLLTHAVVHYKAYNDRPLLRTKEDSLVVPSFAENRWHDSLPPHIPRPAMARADSANGHTTHFVATDREGNIVSITQSLGPIMGSKAASKKYGFLFATTMGPYLGTVKAGERAASHISPIILYKDGQPVMALGAAGGARIVPAIVQVISRIVDQGMTPQQALAAARVFQNPDRLLVETHPEVYWREEGTWQRLQSSGHKVEAVRNPGQFGRIHMLLRKGGSWIGAADPDWSGTAMGER